MSRITVIIPCYNLGEFAPEAVNSVLSQEGVNVKIFLIDDGSTDPLTVQRLDELEQLDRVKLIRTENRGVAAARNTGLSESDSEYVSFLDADDRYLPDALQKMSSALAANPQAALACPAYRRMDTGQRIHRPAWNPLALLTTNTLSVPCLVRRSMIGQARFRTTERGFEYEDWDFWIQVTRHAPALSVPEVLYEYRVRPGSRGRQGNRHHQEVLEDLHRFNADVFDPGKLMDLKRTWCPAVSVIVSQDETRKRWGGMLEHHPAMDAEVLLESDMPSEGISRGEKILGKYVLHDLGKASPEAAAFYQALKSLETFGHPGKLKAGWSFSLRGDLDPYPDPTARLARRYAFEEDLEKLSRLDEKLWRLSCPAWTSEKLPEGVEELVGETGRARHMAVKLESLKLLPYALFGAGQFTKRLLGKDALAPRPKIIFDDNPKADSISGIEVRKPGSTPGIKAVVISSDAYERTLYKRALEIFPKDLLLLRLYS